MGQPRFTDLSPELIALLKQSPLFAELDTAMREGAAGLLSGAFTMSRIPLADEHGIARAMADPESRRRVFRSAAAIISYVVSCAHNNDAVARRREINQLHAALLDLDEHLCASERSDG